MFKKIILSGAMGAALVVGVAGCSQNEVARPGTVVDDLFAPSVSTGSSTITTSTTAVPAIPVAEPEITTYAVPEPQVQVVGASSSLMSQPITAPAPQFVSAPPLLSPSGGFEAPLAPPSFDCDELPTSKTSLVQYRRNCL